MIRCQTSLTCFLQSVRKIFKFVPPLIISEHRNSIYVSITDQKHWGSETLAGWGHDLQPFQEFSKFGMTLALPHGLNACWQLDYARCTARMLHQICVTLKNCWSCILRLFCSYTDSCPRSMDNWEIGFQRAWLIWIWDSSRHTYSLPLWDTLQCGKTHAVFNTSLK